MRGEGEWWKGGVVQRRRCEGPEANASGEQQTLSGTDDGREALLGHGNPWREEEGECEG